MKESDFASIDSFWENTQKFKSGLYSLPLHFENDLGDYPAISGGVPLDYEITLNQKNSKAYVDNDDHHTLVIGSTGSKKTRLTVMPSLYYLIHSGESVIVTDPKGELYSKMYDTMKNKGYNVHVINLRDPDRSVRWNPLLIPYNLYKNSNQDKARELIDDLSRNIIPVSNKSDPFWSSSAQDFLLGLTELLFKNSNNESEINFRSIMKMKVFGLYSGYLEKYLDHVEENSVEYGCLSGTVKTADVTQRGIIATFDQNMRVFLTQDSMAEMLSFNEIDFHKIGFEKTAIFLIIPDEKTTYHKLVSIFIKQCYEQLILNAQIVPDKRLPIRVNFVLDEFSSLPRIDDFPSMITASRSRNIRFTLIIQSNHQLKTKYGDESETIKSNCSNWIFLTGKEIDFLKELSTLCGTGKENEPLISTSKLQRLVKTRDYSEALILHDRNYPTVNRLYDIDKIMQLDSNQNTNDADILPIKNKRQISIFDLKKCVDDILNENDDEFLDKDWNEIISTTENSSLDESFSNELREITNIIKGDVSDD